MYNVHFPAEYLRVDILEVVEQLIINRWDSKVLQLLLKGFAESTRDNESTPIANTLFSNEACLVDAEREKNLSYTVGKILISMLDNGRDKRKSHTWFFPAWCRLPKVFRRQTTVWWQLYLAFLLLNALKGKRTVLLYKSNSNILAGYRMFISVGGAQFLDATFLSRKRGMSRILHNLVKDSRKLV